MNSAYIDATTDGFSGRKTDCHFCSVRNAKATCHVLKDFYNADKPDMADNLCGGCPFYKTDEEFWAGFKKRSAKEEFDEEAV